MATNATTKRVWLLIKRLDENGVAKETLKSFVWDHEWDSIETQQVLREQLPITDNSLIFKLRNHRGSLIVLSGKLPTNSKSSPYILEVVKKYQNVKPQPRSVKLTKYEVSVKKTLEGFILRIEKLEGAVPEVKTKRNAKITQDMEELDIKLKFLEKRFKEADRTKWEGMFTRHPLW